MLTSVLIGLSTGLVVLGRVFAERREQAGNQAREEDVARWHESEALRLALIAPASLLLDVQDQAFTVDTVDDAVRGDTAVEIVMRSVSHFMAEADGSKPFPDKDRRAIHKGFPGLKIPDHVPVYHLPLRYTAAANGRDRLAFTTFVEKVKGLPERISLPDLSRTAEAAYLESRPAGFDFNAYYRSNM